MAIQVKQMAVDVVEGLAGGQEGIDKLAPSAATLLPALLRLITAPGSLSKAALTALINLSQARLTPIYRWYPPLSCMRSLVSRRELSW